MSVPHAQEWEVRDSDGRGWTFEPFAALGPTAAAARDFFQGALSQNARQESRYRTNKTSHAQTARFLKWLLARTGEFSHLNEAVLTEYRTHVEESLAPTSASAVYGRVASFAEFMISTGRVPAFVVPRGESYYKALSFGSGGKTLAEAVPPELAQGGSHNELNTEILLKLGAFCWEAIEKSHRRAATGLRWRSEAEAEGTISLHPALEDPCSQLELTRSECLEQLVKFLWANHGGFIPPTRLIRKDLSRCTPGSAEWAVGNCLRGPLADRLTRAGEAPITHSEIQQHLWPSSMFLAPFMALFAMAFISAGSICELERDMLRDDSLEPGKKSIVFDKGRAGGDVEAGPFPIGGANARSIPRAWGLIDAATEPLRPLAAPELRNRLLLFMSRRKDNWVPGGVMAANVFQYRDGIKALLDLADGTKWKLLVALREQLASLKLIRTTAINVARARLGNAKQTGEVVRHNGTRTLEVSYLNNPYVKAELDDHVVASQQMMVEWTKSGITIVPNDRGSITAQLDGMSDAADALLADELNMGFGVSLVNTKAIVIDTPLNCLRMLQYLRRIQESRDLILIENPARWEKYWEPQAVILAEALHDFPRSTRAAAEQLDKEYQLKFPEVR